LGTFRRRLIEAISNRLEAEMMNKPNVADWLTLTANFAVVTGIIFLAVELRQNNELLLSESRQAAMSNDQSALLVALDNVDIFDQLLSSEELSNADQFRNAARSEMVGQSRFTMEPS
jgi:hypothetical protein